VREDIRVLVEMKFSSEWDLKQRMSNGVLVFGQSEVDPTNPGEERE